MYNQQLSTRIHLRTWYISEELNATIERHRCYKEAQVPHLCFLHVCYLVNIYFHINILIVVKYSEHDLESSSVGNEQ